MASKTIVQREKTAEALRGVLVSHAEEAAEELSKALEPEVSDEVEMPAMEDFQILLRRRLETSRRRLVAADEAHLKVLRRLTALRGSRDGAVGEVRRLLARLRHAIEGVYGLGTSAEVLLLEGPTPRDPVVLQRTAARVLEQLEEHGLPRPEEALVGIDLAPHLWIELLRDPLDRLGHHLTALTHDKRDAVDALLAKNAAKKAYDRLYASTTRMLQEFFRYVGMDEMASTIRPRRRKAAEQAPTEDQAEIETPDGDIPDGDIPDGDIPDLETAHPLTLEASPVLSEHTGLAEPTGLAVTARAPHLTLLPAPRAPDPPPSPRSSA